MKQRRRELREQHSLKCGTNALGNTGVRACSRSLLIKDTKELAQRPNMTGGDTLVSEAEKKVRCVRQEVPPCN